MASRTAQPITLIFTLFSSSGFMASISTDSLDGVSRVLAGGDSSEADSHARARGHNDGADDYDLMKLEGFVVDCCSGVHGVAGFGVKGTGICPPWKFWKLTRRDGIGRQ